MGTATQVIDAQNALSALKTEMALNAYKYVHVASQLCCKAMVLWTSLKLM